LQDIVNGTDHQPILQVTNVVAGRYVFILKVSDADGLSNIDTASIIVRQDKQIRNLVEIHIKADLKSFTEANKVCEAGIIYPNVLKEYVTSDGILY
jgi:hypothetical protein